MQDLQANNESRFPFPIFLKEISSKQNLKAGIFSSPSALVHFTLALHEVDISCMSNLDRCIPTGNCKFLLGFHTNLLKQAGIVCVQTFDL